MADGCDSGNLSQGVDFLSALPGVLPFSLLSSLHNGCAGSLDDGLIRSEVK